MRRIPSTLSILRLLAAPLLGYVIVRGHPTGALVVFLCLASTDVLDGVAARALRATSSSGAYLDVSADFAVVMAGFGSLAVLGVYPWWMLGLFTVMFGQFLVTSGRVGPPRYDPIGKHYGLALYGALGLTLALPELALARVITAVLLVLTAVSLASRAAYLLGFEA